MQKILESKNKQTCLLIALFATLLCLRAPYILIYGRFWAEEGSVFFHNAFVQPPLKALFFVFGGYLNLATNASTLIARWAVPIYYAPYVTIFIGLFFQILPLFLLLTSKNEWLSSFRTRLLITLLLLLVPASSEIALQSLHIQFQLALCCAIIAFLGTETGYQRWLRLSILFLSPLCGLIVIPLLVVFGLRAFVDRNRLRYEQILVLSIGSFVQLFFFYDPFSNSARSYNFSFIDFLVVSFARDIVIPFFGQTHATMNLIQHLYQIRMVHHIPFLICFVPIIAFGIIIFCLIKYPKTRPALWLLISAIILRAISIYGAIGGGLMMIDPYSSERYVFCSQALFFLILVVFSVTLPKKGKIIARFFIVWLILVGVFNYFHPFSATTNGSSWHREIYLWEKDHHYFPKGWPAVWFIDIP